MWEIVLDHTGDAGLSRQIYLFFKTRILSGQIAQGEALPSTRELAAALQVSRNTVGIAYDMLWTEGFILRRQGAPSRVAEGLIIHTLQQAEARELKPVHQPEIRWDFRSGQPDLSVFPWYAWNEQLKEAAAGLTARQFAYSGPKGYAPLCEEIAGWLYRSRGMTVDPGDVFITSGATQALYLLIQLLHRKHAAFALENPSHPGIRNIIADKGAKVVWMPVDPNGAAVETLEGHQIAAAYVTPSHQFPLGGILPAARRAALLRLAAEKNFYIIEDDYDSEFRYTGAPVSSIYAMDAPRVIYVGTFSKTIFPALRLGFAVLPKALHAEWRHSRKYMDVQNPVLEQAALTRFMQTRRMDKHVRRMRRLYGAKRVAMLQAVRSAFGDAAVPWGDASGLHVALQFPGRTFDSRFVAHCQQAGLRIQTLSAYCASPAEHMDMLLMGYGHLSAGQISEGIKALHDCIGCSPCGKNTEKTNL